MCGLSALELAVRGETLDEIKGIFHGQAPCAAHDRGEVARRQIVDSGKLFERARIGSGQRERLEFIGQKPLGLLERQDVEADLQVE